MAANDREYKDIQEIIRRLRNIEEKVRDLEVRMGSVEQTISVYAEKLLDEQTVAEMIQKEVSAIPIKQHDHRSSSQGGDAFASLGGNLI